MKRPKSSGFTKLTNVGNAQTTQNRVKYTQQKLTPEFIEKQIVVEEIERPKQWEESQGSNNLRNSLKEFKSLNDKNTTSKKDKFSKSILSNPKKYPYNPIYKHSFKERVSPLTSSSNTMKSKTFNASKMSKPGNLKAGTFKSTHNGQVKESIATQGFERDE